MHKNSTSSVNTDKAITKRKAESRHIIHNKILNSTEIQKHYQYKHLIGRGTYGIVYEIKDKKTDVLMALKIIPKGALGNKRDHVEREICILKLVDHPHIIHLELIFESLRKYYLVFELCNGTLHDLLHRRGTLHTSEVKIIIRDLSSAVAYLHRNDIVHRDLKLENVLLTTNPDNHEDKLFVKISDFGLSTILEEHSYKSMLTTVCGTTPYMAPEILSTHSYSQQCDIWALGIIMYLLLTGKFPFFHNNEDELKEIICKVNINFSHLDISQDLCDLMMKMLDKNPAFRITSPELEVYACLTGDIGRSVDTVFDKMKRWKSELKSSNDREPATSDWLTATPSDIISISVDTLTPVSSIITNIEKETKTIAYKTKKQNKK